MTRLHFMLSILLLATTLHPHASLAAEPNLIETQFPIYVQSNTMASQLSNLLFKRIRVATLQDIDRLYPVLTAYIQNPTLASSVTELVIDVPSWSKYSSSSSFLPKPHDESQASTAASPNEIAAHEKVNTYVRNLGLSNDATKSMLQSLSWKFNGHPSPANPDDAHSVYYGYGPSSVPGFASTASTLLLSLCRNLSLLHAYDLNHANLPLRDFLLRNNHGRLHDKHLQRLETVQLQAWMPRDEREYDTLEFLEYFRYFGRLPGMRTYSAEGVIEFQNERVFAPPGSSKGITKISITNADVSADMVGSMIRIPRGLEEFTLSMGGLEANKGGGPLVFPKTLGKCLLEQKGTLRVLDMDLDCVLLGSSLPMEAEEEDVGEGYGGDEYTKDEWFRLDEQAGNGRPLSSFDLPNTRKYGLTMGSLHDFEALEHLAISVRLLMGPIISSLPKWKRATAAPPFRLVDALPRGLKSLYLYDYIKGQCTMADEHVEELKEKMAERFPFLREVKGVDEPLFKTSGLSPGSDISDDGSQSELEMLRSNDRGLDWELAGE